MSFEKIDQATERKSIYDNTVKDIALYIQDKVGDIELRLSLERKLSKWLSNKSPDQILGIIKAVYDETRRQKEDTRESDKGATKEERK